MTGISTHVLDTSRGQPARGVRAVLELASPEGTWLVAGEGVTDSNGRIPQLLDAEPMEAGVYRLTFYTGDYFEGQETFYPEISILFTVRDAGSHHHVPLLLSPYGYSTYRGS